MGKIDLTVSVDAELVSRARDAGLDIDAITAQALDAALVAPDRPVSFVESARRKALDPEGGEARTRVWAEENREAIQAHRDRIAEYGVFGEDLRRW